MNNNYRLIPIKNPDEAYFEIYINADSNDGDYISRTTKLSQAQFDEYGVNAIRIINQKLIGHHRLTEGWDELTEEELYDVGEISFPSSDWGMCHTIEDFDVLFYDTLGNKFKVDLI